MEPDDDDQLSNLRIVVKDDQKIIAAARWLPRVELRCRGKTCRLLGGHQACTNAIMVWCTCPERDSAHPDSSRLMALDAWVVEHCRGENLDDYESQEDEEEEDEEGQGSEVDALCMGEAMVLRAGPNVLPKPIPLRRLLASNLVAQGGNRGLKGACFWVYWYDQPIPFPSAPEYAGMGRTWAPGPLAQEDLGVWYKAKIIKCDTTSGEVKIRYDIDGNEDTLYLLVAFAHFGMEPPTRGSPPEVLPDMDLVESLGLPQSAAGSLSASAGSKGKGRAAAAATKKVAATKPAATAATAAKPQTKQQVKGAASPDKQPGRASAAAAPPPPPPPPQPAAAPGSLQRAPSSTSAVTLPAAEAGAGAAGVVVGVKQVVPLKVKPPAKRPSSPSAVPLPPKPPSAKKQPKPAPPQQQQQQQPIKKEDAAPARLAVPAAPAAGGAAAPPTGVPGSRVGPVTRPAKRPRHEFELVPLAAGSGQGPAASGAATTATATTTWPPPPLSAAAWAEREERARRGRRGFVGFLCGRQEQVPVPVFNEVDSAPPPAPSEYLSAADFEGRLAAALSEARRRQPAVAAAMEELQSLCERAQPRWGQSCGKTYHDVVRQRESNERTNAAAAGGGGAAPDPSPESSYGPDGRLLVARPLGVHECSPTCSSASCRANMTLSRGVHRPLEVFRSRDGAWSLRCAEALEPGELVAPLLGRLVPAAQLVEELGAGPEGLPGPPGVVLLNHFFALWEAAYTRGLNWCDRHVRLWQLPPNPLTSALRSGGGGSSGGGTTAATAATTPNDDDPARPAVKRLTCMLALDTRHVGNVARFVRQWAAPAAVAAPPLGPALVAQPVLAGGCRSPLLYYVGLFAARRVEAGEELSCDFSVMALGGVGPGGVAGPAR
ncbi:hypothetical protein PLESTF_000823800 [Pleodorina starrii]|nr:hypothetical protein PLESTM_000174900 [Pleodorina starrii]GLC69383.1 hypothetical protein PLESTF_000823800 [Pleodorina starrii]